MNKDIEYVRREFKKLRALHALDGLQLEDVVEVLEMLLEIYKSEIEK